MRLAAKILFFSGAGPFLAALLALYALIPSPWGTNQAGRYELVRAIAIDGHFYFDRRVHQTFDWSAYNGHYYLDKAPGGAILGVTPVWLAVTLERLAGADPENFDRLHHFLVDLFTTCIPGVLISLLLFLHWEAYPAPHGLPSSFALLAYSLGSLAFPYSLSNWGEQTAALFLFASFHFLTYRNRFFLAGLAFGFGVLTDYAVAVTLPAFIVWLCRPSKPKATPPLASLLRFAAGGFLPFLLFASYHQICFGAWYRPALSVGNPEFVDEKKFLGVLNLPRPGALYDLLFGLDRGLVVLAPLTILAPWGVYRWAKRSVQDGELIFSLWICLALWLFNGSFNGWYGGCCVGTRYLVPTLPFIYSMIRWLPPRKIVYILTAWSVFNMTAISIGNVALCARANVLWQQVYPALVQADALKRTLPIALGTCLVGFLATRIRVSRELPLIS